MRAVDLNADVGESSGTLVVGDDRGLMPWITSANVAAGVHAGDPSTLRRTVRLAREAGVAVGAHPGFADRESVGRSELVLASSELEDLVLYQVATVSGVAAAEGIAIRHVKLHGALYNIAARDRSVANAAVKAIAAFDRNLLVFGPSGSALLDAAREAGLPAVAEFFADRAYESDGSLVARSRSGALLTDPQAVATRAIRMIRDGVVETIDRGAIRMQADTICVHSDTPGAAVIAKQLRVALEGAGIRVSAPDARRAGRDGEPFR